MTSFYSMIALRPGARSHRCGSGDGETSPRPWECSPGPGAAEAGRYLGQTRRPPPLPVRVRNVTEGLAIRPVTTVAIGPDGNPVVNAPQPVPVSGKPVSDDRAEAIKDYQANLPATVRIRQIGGTIPTTGSPVGTVQRCPANRPPSPKSGRPYSKGRRSEREPRLSGHPTPAQKKAINDACLQVGSPKPTVDQIKAIRDVSAVVVRRRPRQWLTNPAPPPNVGKEPPAVTMGTKTTPSHRGSKTRLCQVAGDLWARRRKRLWQP